MQASRVARGHTGITLRLTPQLQAHIHPPFTSGLFSQFRRAIARSPSPPGMRSFLPPEHAPPTISQAGGGHRHTHMPCKSVAAVLGPSAAVLIDHTWHLNHHAHARTPSPCDAPRAGNWLTGRLRTCPRQSTAPPWAIDRLCRSRHNGTTVQTRCPLPHSTHTQSPHSHPPLRRVAGKQSVTPLANCACALSNRPPPWAIDRLRRHQHSTTTVQAPPLHVACTAAKVV